MALPLPSSLPLFPEELPPRRPYAPAVSAPRAVTKQLWLAVHFPRLSLEALRIHPASHEPVAAVDGVGTKTCIIDCTKDAADKGVRPGQMLNAALALEPHLRIVRREAASEQAALIRLADVGQGFTPTVSMEQPAGLLLEVEGSAHLFGGPDAILGKVKEAFAGHGFTPTVALAPTPVAALWLSRAGIEIHVTDRAKLRSALGALPLHAIAWPKGTADAFNRLGLERLVDVLRLPRDGLAKRFGKEFVQSLDRALGNLPDPRSSWNKPRRCRLTRELPGELIQVDHMKPWVNALIDDLAGELRSHDAAVDRVRIVFRHWKQPPTSVVVGSASPHRDAGRWRELVHGRLAVLQLIAPAHEVQVLSGRFLPHAGATLDLLGGRTGSEEPLRRLVDTLRARWGRTGVTGVAMADDARPEHASRDVEPGAAARNEREADARPIHMLATPLPLSTSDDKPRYRGSTLALVDGPERIDGGWWAMERWTRDYHEAVSTRGERLWVFREGGHWFLHGLFS